MDTAIVGGARSIQLIVLAILLVVAIVMGAKMALQGQRGFALVLPEVAIMLVALWVVARPNDLITLLLGLVGGIQTPTLPH